MCWEDLRLGKAKRPDTPINTNATTNEILKSDNRRVGLLISFSGVLTFDGAGVVIVNDSFTLHFGSTTAGPRIIRQVGGMEPFMLTIEQVGILVNGPFSVTVTDVSGTASLNIVPILYDGEIPGKYGAKD